MFSITKSVALFCLVAISMGFRLGSNGARSFRPVNMVVENNKNNKSPTSNPVETTVNFVGKALSNTFAPTDHQVIPELLVTDMPKFHTDRGKKSWKTYKKHNWANDDAARNFANRFMKSDQAFDYWVVQDDRKDHVRIYATDPSDTSNPAKYIAFGMSQALSPIDKDPSHPSNKSLPKFHKAMTLSDLKKELKKDPFYFE